MGEFRVELAIRISLGMPDYIEAPQFEAHHVKNTSFEPYNIIKEYWEELGSLFLGICEPGP